MEAERLEGLRLGVVEDRLEAKLSAGRGPELVAELERLCRSPLSTRTARRSADGGAVSVRPSVCGLRRYRAARHRLADELGLEPSPHLRELRGPDPRTRSVAPAHLERPETEAGNAVRRTVAPSERRFAGSSGVAGSWRVGCRGAWSVVAVANLRCGADQLVLLRSRDGGRHDARSDVGAGAVATRGRSIWVAAPDENAVIRVDPTGKLTDRVPLPVQPGEVVAGGGAVWVSRPRGHDREDRPLHRCDRPDDSRRRNARRDVFLLRRTLGGRSGRPCCSSGGSRAGASSEKHHGSRIEPDCDRAGHGALWVASYEAGTITELEPSTASPVSVIHVGQGPSSLAFGGGSLWVANTLDGTVSEVDTERASVRRTIPTGSSPSAVTFAGGAVWVADQSSARVSRIRAVTVRSRRLWCRGQCSLDHLITGRGVGRHERKSRATWG